MIELVVTVCLASAPERCKEVALTDLGAMSTPMQCLMQAQPELARWAEAHPRWTVKRWTCQRAGLFAKI